MCFMFHCQTFTAFRIGNNLDSAPFKVKKSTRAQPPSNQANCQVARDCTRYTYTNRPKVTQSLSEHIFWFGRSIDRQLVGIQNNPRNGVHRYKE